MKLILRQYLADLRERDELDAVLPDLVSEPDCCINHDMGILSDGLLGCETMPEPSDVQGQSYVRLNLTGGELAPHAALV